MDAFSFVAYGQGLDELLHLEGSSLALFVQFITDCALYRQWQWIIGAVGHC